jgi:cardiolipin synthase A/B
MAVTAYTSLIGRTQTSSCRTSQTVNRATAFSLGFLVLAASLATLGGGCAPLPNVAELTAGVPPAHSPTPAQIASANGFLSPKQSQALLARLQQASGGTDILNRYTAVMESVTDRPLTKGNTVTLLVDGPATFATMFRAVEHARDHIHLETFSMEDVDDGTGHKLADLLLQKQAAGVSVKVIYDSVGSFSTPAAFFQRLRDGGIQVAEFNPIDPSKARGRWRLAQPDHRKLLIVDGTVAITGGVNFSRVYSSSPSAENEGKAAQLPWRDTDAQIEGPAVAEFQALFLETWEKQTGVKLSAASYFPALKEVGKDLVGVLSSPAGEARRITFIMYVTAITFAENSVHMTNAYFVPDQQTVAALTAAARRGVDVRIVLPSATDSSLAQSAGEYTYAELLESGVKLYRRRYALLHAKTLVIDGVWSTVGSTNMDFWSSSTNAEVNAVILSREFAREMEHLFSSDLAQADEIRWVDWKERPWRLKVREWLSHLLAHWL